jgi:hypothetical protein
MTFHYKQYYHYNFEYTEMRHIVLILALFLNWDFRGAAAYSPLTPNTKKVLIESSSSFVSRRKLLVESSVAAAVVGTSSILITPQTSNAIDTLTKYQDVNCKFSINLPSDWPQSTQTLPDRRRIVLYIKPDSDQKTLIFLAYTPVRDDFTSLSSFGSVDQVAQATILPKGELAGVEGVESEMLSAATKPIFLITHKRFRPNRRLISVQSLH